MVEVIEHVYGL